MTTPTRRSVLIGGTVGAVAALIGSAPTALAASASASGGGAVARTWNRDTSRNGWRIDPRIVQPFYVSGAARTVTLHPAAAQVLLHVVRRWHYEIQRLTDGTGTTLHGHTTDRTVYADYESNHLSGSAVALHPGAFPAGGGDGLYPHQQRIVGDIIADCDGLVTWGGDLKPAKYGHFHINVPAASPRLKELAKRLGDPTGERPYDPAGAPADPADPARRQQAVRARGLARRNEH
ncbi:hypothetical protein ACFWY5_41595 [Nonomuraea sp. NPDC059007]|uniref:hypothetical protein n=1 Tax=Nonomuraea sp. NPDC059007 TaxID=3346692 RepID=UPI0036AAAE9B